MLGCKLVDTLIKQNCKLEVAHLRNGIFISQKKYILDLKETRMLNWKSTDTPIERNHKLGEPSEDIAIDKESY